MADLTASQKEPQMTQVSSADKSGGLDVFAGFRQVNGTVTMDLEITNVSCPATVSSLAIQLNKNAFGLSPSSQQIVLAPPVSQGTKSRASVELVVVIV